MGTFLLVNVDYILSFAYIDVVVHCNVVTISSSACTNEPSGEDLCTRYVAVTEKVLKSDCEILTG